MSLEGHHRVFHYPIVELLEIKLGESAHFDEGDSALGTHAVEGIHGEAGILGHLVDIQKSAAKGVRVFQSFILG